MTDLKQYLNYAFEINDENGNQIDKIYGPGELCLWLSDPEASPMFVAIIPAPYEIVAAFRDKCLFKKVIRIPLDKDGNEKLTEKDEIVLYEAKTEKDAKELARQAGCDYMYWSEWDGARVMVIVDADCNDEWTKGNFEAYHIDED
jgi:hypothetical protein